MERTLLMSDKSIITEMDRFYTRIKTLSKCIHIGADTNKINQLPSITIIIIFDHVTSRRFYCKGYQLFLEQMAQQLFKKVGQQMLTKLGQQMLMKLGQQMLTKLGQQMLTKIDRQLFHTIATDGRLAGANQQMFLTYTIDTDGHTIAGRRPFVTPDRFLCVSTHPYITTQGGNL